MKKIAVALLSLVAVTSWSFALLASTKVDNLGTVATLPKKGMARAVNKIVVPWQSRGNQPAVSLRTNPLFISRAKVENPPQVLGAQTSGTQTLSQEQVIDLVKPGVVSIINWMDGKLTVPDFDVDLKTFALIPRPDLKQHELSAAWSVYGSGFVVNPDGYIITNAHVISKNSVYEKMDQDVSDHWNELYKSEQNSLSDKEYKAYQKYLDDTYGVGDVGTGKINKIIDEEIIKYVNAQKVDEITQNVVVVDKSQKGMSLPEGSPVEAVFNRGMPAKIVDFDPNFKDSQKDVALLKINQEDAPALPLGSDENVATGQATLIFGYPYNAQISEADFFEPTLTQGIVGAVKQYNGQKIIQLDNKISPGSSGGPLVDTQGQVIGLVTFETGKGQSGGDNFGFALPVQVVKDILGKNGIFNNLGVYGTNLLAGFASQSSSLCKNALDSYNMVLTANSHFILGGELSNYIKPCQDLISNKMSKDSTWDAIRIFYKENTVNSLIFSILALLILGFGVTLITKLIKHLQQKKFEGLIIPHPPQNIQGF